MSDKPAHDGSIDLSEREPPPVEPMQQMGRGAQMSAALAALVAALDQMPSKGIEQRDARIAAQAGDACRRMEEMFKHGASPSDNPRPTGRAVPQVYAQYFVPVIPEISTRKETRNA
jgi:hypothetical protein